VSTLVGEHEYQLDTKGRIPLPVKFRVAFSEGGFMTLGVDGCLWLFPAEQYGRRADEMQDHSIADTTGLALERMFFANSEPVGIDKQGRIALSPRLRADAGLGREVTVVGSRDRLEIWDRDAWKRYREQYTGSYLSGSLYRERRV
jgi:MraZ protein